jgi:hypothetical protein
MPSSFGPELKRKLRAQGCVFVRTAKGDHEVWYSPITKRNITVDAGCKSRFTANRVLNDAGIEERF